MQHLNRDNFRHLTGLGREVATYVDAVISDWVHQGSQVPVGDVTVFNDVDIGHFSYEFAPCVAMDSDRRTIGGVKTTDHASLNIVTRKDSAVEIIGLPLIMTLANVRDLSGTYQVYQHDFLFDEFNNPISNACYIGITKRGWRTRWAEHIRSANSGSHYRFHQAIRQWSGSAKAVSHCIVACGLSERAAMGVEEEVIARDTLYPRGLNMVPGGNAGLAYLRKIGAIGARERVSPDDRQDIINRFFETASRKGLPNPLAAANWLNPEYAEKVICAGPDRLKPQQIRDARFFSSLGRDISDIAVTIGARSIDQVKRVLSGATYSRIA